MIPDDSGKPTGLFRGSFTEPQIAAGTWSTPDGKRSFPFQLSVQRVAVTLQTASPHGKTSSFQIQTIFATDRVSGKYKTGLDQKSESGAVLNILLLDDGRLRIQGDATWVGNAQAGVVHVGSVNGTAKLDGDTANYLKPHDTGDSCRFTIRFTIRGITVTDDNMRCGGLNVTFNGTYTRTGPPEFEEPFVR